MKMKKLMMIGVLALTMGQASAQRCLPKMQGIEVMALSWTANRWMQHSVAA